MSYSDLILTFFYVLPSLQSRWRNVAIVEAAVRGEGALRDKAKHDCGRLSKLLRIISLHVFIMSSKTTTNKTSIHALGECYQGDEYLKRYKAFLAKYQLVEHNLETLGVCLPSAIKTFSFQEDVCKVLSVGAADGELDLQVVKVVKDISKKKVYNRVIEPNEYSLNRYRESITTKLPPELSGDNVIFDLGKPRTFQEYMAEEKMDSVKFDIVHFIQSIYYMDMEEALTHCYNNELGEHGIIICIIGKHL